MRLEGAAYFRLLPPRHAALLAWVCSLGIELNVVTRSFYSSIPSALPQARPLMVRC
jgi:hypothetical protein